MNITSGIVPRARKCCIYGAEGIGKTTLASKFPDPVIIDTEGGTAHIDVRRITGLRNWEDLIATVEEVARTPDVCQTLAIDTADWAEQMAVRSILAKNKKNSIEEFPYGKGYTYIADEFSRLLKACDKVIAANIHVVITAHAKMRKFEQPDEMGAYDRWEMKLTRQVAPLLKEWCDFLFFCNYKTTVVTTDTNARKAQGGKRVIYTNHHPAWDAKCRAEMPDMVDMDFHNIEKLFPPLNEKAAQAPAEKPIVTLRAMMEKDGVADEELQAVVASKGHYGKDVPIEQYSDRFIAGWVIRYWANILDMVKTDRAILEI